MKILNPQDLFVWFNWSKWAGAPPATPSPPRSLKTFSSCQINALNFFGLTVWQSYAIMENGIVNCFFVLFCFVLF